MTANRSMNTKGAKDVTSANIQSRGLAKGVRQETSGTTLNGTRRRSKMKYSEWLKECPCIKCDYKEECFSPSCRRCSRYNKLQKEKTQGANGGDNERTAGCYNN